MKIFTLTQIQQVIDISANLDALLGSQRRAFIDFTDGLYQSPLPMQMAFSKYNSDCHVKAAYRQDSETFVTKIANSSQYGIDGAILLFSARTGQLQAMLHDNGWLTVLRTAIAGMLASELLHWQIHNIGIIGSGHLAKMLYDVAKMRYPKAHIHLYARNKNKALNITHDICASADELVAKCDLIFTATSSSAPIIKTSQCASPKAIIALGSDDEHKQEIAYELFEQSDCIIVDSKQQAVKFGDVANSISAGIIKIDQTTELGHALEYGIPDSAKLIIADFSGIAAQDCAMAEFILSRLSP